MRVMVGNFCSDAPGPSPADLLPPRFGVLARGFCISWNTGMLQRRILSQDPDCYLWLCLYIHHSRCGSFTSSSFEQARLTVPSRGPTTVSTGACAPSRVQAGFSNLNGSPQFVRSRPEQAPAFRACSGPWPSLRPLIKHLLSIGAKIIDNPIHNAATTKILIPAMLR